MKAETCARQENIKRIGKMTNDELRRHLLSACSSCYGIEFKGFVLDELLERKYDEGWSNGEAAGEMKYEITA